MSSIIAQHFLSPPIGRLSFAKLSPDCRGDFLFKRLRRGDIGVDGRAFFKHAKSYRLGQYWMYADRFHYERKKARVRSIGRRSQNPFASKVATRILIGTQSAIARQIIGMDDVCRDIGCSRDELCDHLESLFIDGMSWENFSKWHIDHIRPLSSFDMLDPSERSRANHFSNLQPLWALDNLKKSNRM